MKLKLSVKSYILIEVISMFSIAVLALTFVSNFSKNKSYCDLSIDYTYKYSQSILSVLEGEIEEAGIVSNILNLWSKRVFDTPQSIDFAPHTSPIFDPAHPEHIYLKQVLKSFPSLSSFYVATIDGQFCQIRRVQEYDQTQSQPNIPLPKNADYALRLLLTQNGVGQERWIYYSQDGHKLHEEVIYPCIYTPQARPWYIQAMEEKHRITTDVYYFGTIKNLVQTWANPIIGKNNQIIGINGVDLDIRKISMLLSKSKTSKKAELYIIQNDDVIASSNLEMPMFLTGEKTRIAQVDEFRKTPLWNALKHSQDSKMEQFILTDNHEDYSVCILPFSDQFKQYTNKNWQLAVLIPQSDILAPLLNVSDGNLMVYIFLILLVMVNIVIIARRISDPIEEITQEANAIRAFNFKKESFFSSSLLELNQLKQSVDLMKYSINSFFKYMPKRLVLRLLEKKQEVVLGGETAPVTMFFSDIVGFSTLSEKMQPHDLICHISEYFENLTQLIMQEQGTVDKYIGDAIMALWGAPDSDDQQQYNACKAALLCQHEIRTLNKKWQEEGKPELHTRIGIHYGEVVVGNMGSSDRMSYTVLGDNVNLAARLEGINKYYGTYIIVSEAIHDVVKNSFLMRPLDLVSVKGKTKGVIIYELLGEFEGPEHLRPESSHVHFVSIFEKLFQFYLHMNFSQALTMLEELQTTKLFPETVAMYIERCQHYLENPPSADWDGINHFQSK